MSGTRDCLQNNIECVQPSVKSLDSVIENIQATQSIQCKQTQKLIEVQDSDGDLLSETDAGVAISIPTMDWAAEDPQPFIINHNRAFHEEDERNEEENLRFRTNLHQGPSKDPPSRGTVKR